VKRVTRSMTGVLPRKQYLDISERKHSSIGTGRLSVFKLGEWYVVFAVNVLTMLVG